MFDIYDTIIIGAGIAGATVAYALTQQNQKVLVLDKNGIASGGSGAAGAFVSPKIGKGSVLQTLTNEAFVFARDFYEKTCPEYFHQTGVIRMPKDEADADKFGMYEKKNDTAYEYYTKEKLQALGIDARFDSFYFPDAGDCDAPKVCEFLLRDIEVKICNVEKISFQDKLWQCVLAQENENILHCKAKNIVLATGYESELVDMRYMGIQGKWGTRGDFCSALDLNVSMHQSMSVGANIDGVIKLGATHENGIKAPIPCSSLQAKSLKEQASLLIDTTDLVLKEVFCAMRAGAKDYFPLVGKVIDVSTMLETYPSITKGTRPPLSYVDNLYVLNGLGGRGFVFAPLMAKILTDKIVENKEIDKRVNADRLFLKWCRKL